MADRDKDEQQTDETPRKMQCPLCGHWFQPTENPACEYCPKLFRSCGSVICPHCGHESPR